MERNFILIKTRQYVERIPVEEIMAIERDGRRLTVICEDGEHTFSGNMEEIVPFLGESFYRCHSGCYVNLEKIRRLKDQFIVFFNGYSLYLGRTNFIKAKAGYYDYHRANNKIG